MVLLQRFVSERGGGFLMLGGAESFREGNYAGTVIASMLPVYLDRPANAKLPSKWKLNLTREGWLQPWTRLRATEEDERERLDSMPRAGRAQCGARSQTWRQRAGDGFRRRQQQLSCPGRATIWIGSQRGDDDRRFVALGHAR